MFRAACSTAVLICLVVCESWADDTSTSRRHAAQEQLQAKLTELEALQREITDLRRELGEDQQLLVSIQLIEVNLTKMADFGIEVRGLEANGQLSRPVAEIFTLSLLKGLLKEKIAYVLAEPTVVAHLGQDALFRSGGEVPVPAGEGKVEYKDYGTTIKLKGIAISPDRFRLETRVRYVALDAANTFSLNGKRQPCLSVREIDTGIELNSGETLVLVADLSLDVR